MKSRSALSILACLSLPALAFGLTAEEAVKASGVRGGLVVHAECGDPSAGSGQAGALAAEFAAKKSYLVHGLDTKAENVAAARKRFAGLADATRISADRWNGKALPYADNVVNLLVVSGSGVQVSAPEVGRVLAPRGVAVVEGKTDLSDLTDLTDRSQEAGSPGWRPTCCLSPDHMMLWTRTRRERTYSRGKRPGRLPSRKRRSRAGAARCSGRHRGRTAAS